MSPDIFLVFKFSFSLSGTFFAVRMFNMSYISNHMMTDTSISTMNMAQLDSKLRKAFALLYVVCGYCNGKCSERGNSKCSERGNGKCSEGGNGK